MVQNREKIDNYLSLIKQYPDIVQNISNGLTIITNPDILFREQDKLYSLAESNGKPKQWYDIGLLAEDAWVVVLRDLVQYPNGKYGGYIRVLNRHSQLECNGKDVVIMIRKDGEYLLQQHFRHEDRNMHWECPRGFGEKGISAVEIARNEIQEETGLQINTIDQINNNTERVAYFIADCSGTINRHDTIESINNCIWVNKSKLQSMIAKSEIDDMYTIRAYAILEASKRV